MLCCAIPRSRLFSQKKSARLCGPHHQDPKVRDLFATIRAIRLEWTEHQAAAIEPTEKSPLRIMASPRLESDCFESEGGASYREKKSASTISSAPSMMALPDKGDNDFDIDSVEMTEEQRKMLNDVLADINTLKINQAPPEDVPKEFCPEIFNDGMYHSLSNIDDM